MKIGIIFYSLSGNTRQVAEKIEKNLSAAGHTVSLEEIRISGDTPAQAGKFKLEHVPSVEEFEALILGSPVQAFSLNPVMKAYLDTMPSLKGKKVALFVTKHLPMLWLGGTGAIGIMKKACEKKEARVVGTEIVVWSGKHRSRSIKNCEDSVSRLFSPSN